MRRILLWSPVALWCVLIFIFSGIPDLGTGLGPIDIVLRKFAHVIEYAVLAILLCRALTPDVRVSLVPWLSLLFSVFYAVSDEFHQGFVPGRHPAALDVLLDSMGAAWAAFYYRRMIFSPRSKPVLLISLLMLFGLGCVRVSYLSARSQEKARRHESALKSYMRLASRHPDHKLAPRALYNAGRLACTDLGDYPLARQLFQKVINRYGGDSGWGERAELALFNTPNYFPLVPNGEWVEVDSETGGRNARLEVTCRAREEGGVLFSRRYYAGKQFVRNLSTSDVYVKEALELREFQPGKDKGAVILKYPFERGANWTSARQGRKYRRSIQGLATVKVRAGEFKDCLVVREQPEGISASWKVDYYAPGVGKVLTTLATEKTEQRNTELFSFNLGTAEEATP